MSRMLPISVARALRNANRVAIQVYGIDVTLYLLKNPTVIENLDAYQSVDDHEYTEMPVKCWVEWSPNVYRLRKLGIFNETDLPGLVHFENDIEIPRGSYIKIPITFLPSNQKDWDKFEIADQVIPNLADIDVLRIYKMVPRRVS